MWKASAGKDINVDVSNEDDSWETDPDFINDVTGKILSLFIFLYSIKPLPKVSQKFRRHMFFEIWKCLDK